MKVSTTVVPVTDLAKHEDALELAQNPRLVGFQKVVFQGKDGWLCYDPAGPCYQFLWVPELGVVIAWMSCGVRLEWKRDDWTEETVLRFFHQLATRRFAVYTLEEAD